MIHTGKRIKVKRRVNGSSSTQPSPSSMNYNSNYDISQSPSSPSSSRFNIYASDDVMTNNPSNPSSTYTTSTSIPTTSTSPSPTDIHITDDYLPNQLLIRNLNYRPQQLNPGDLRHIHAMSENSYSDQTSTFSALQSAIIRNMANSVYNETSMLFNTQAETEYRPYEEQSEYQSSRIGHYINRQTAKNITSKYSHNDD